MTAPCKSAKLASAVYTGIPSRDSRPRRRACTVCCGAFHPFGIFAAYFGVPIDHSHNAIALCGKPLRLVVQQRPWKLKQAIDTWFMSNWHAGNYRHSELQSPPVRCYTTRALCSL